MSKQLTVSDIVSMSPDPRRIFPGALCNDFLVGIEIELEHVTNRPSMQYWQWKDDNSLRNNGAELVVPHPVGGLDLEDALHELGVALNNNPNWVANDRCSMHTHLDFRGATLQDVVAFYVTWTLFESSMYTLSGKDRYSNIYCPGVNQCPSLLRSANVLAKQTSRDNIRRVLDSWPRYSGVNLKALLRYGSIEIRTHRGTASATDIYEWLGVLERIKVWSTGKKPQDILDTATRHGREGFAYEVFGTLASKVLCPNYEKYFNVNFLNACDVVHWDEVLTMMAPTINTDIKLMADAIIAELQR